MELLVEFLVEFILEGCLDFALEGMESKKVSMPLRILAAVVLFALLIGLGVLFVFIGLAVDSIALWILLAVVFIGLLGGLTWKVHKVFKRRKHLIDN